MRNILLALVAALGLAVAAPYAPSTAVGYLSASVSGSPTDKQFFCSFSLVRDPSLEAKFGTPVVGLTAGHCLDGFIRKQAGFDYAQNADLWATFDGRSYVAIEWSWVGDTGKGYDVAVFLPVEGETWPAAQAAAAYEVDAKTPFVAGENLETWGYPHGLSLNYARLYVANTAAPRTYGRDINWSGYPIVYGPVAPGQSGSAVFGADGRVRGVVIGISSNKLGWSQGYIFPIAKLLGAL